MTTHQEATRDAIVLLRNRVDFTHVCPTVGDCWLLNAALHLEGRPTRDPARAIPPHARDRKGRR
jgi:hypothetical protein